MAVIPSGFAQANFKIGGGGFPNGAEITLGLDVSGVVLGPSAVASDLIANWGANIDPIVPGTLTLDSVLVKFGPNATGPSAEVPSGNAGSGGGTGTSPAVAWLVHKLTASGGRPGRGRMYMPGVQESEIDTAGNLSAGFVAGAQSAMEDFFDQLGADGTPPVLLHSAASPVSTPTPITGFTVDGVAATQRRRQRR